MLTKADDFPVHQLPEPIATAGTDRNFYDRYFFNGYSADGSVFFAAALGVYPHLNVMDASLSVIDDGVQHNLRASKILNMERMDTTVGPLAVQVIEPLKILRVTADSKEHGIRADITFHARALPVEEPRFTYRQGPLTFMDYTRLTQNGDYEGWIEVAGKRIELRRDKIVGTRDRSWGVRPVGVGSPQGAAPPRLPQFYWLWSPLNFPDKFMLYHNNADADGKPWNTASVIGATGEAKGEHMAACWSKIDYKSGTRHAKHAVIETRDAAGGDPVGPRVRSENVGVVRPSPPSRRRAGRPLVDPAARRRRARRDARPRHEGRGRVRALPDGAQPDRAVLLPAPPRPGAALPGDHGQGLSAARHGAW